jgi:hypothetical protein
MELCTCLFCYHLIERNLKPVSDYKGIFYDRIFFLKKYAQVKAIDAPHPGVDVLVELHRVIKRHVSHCMDRRPFAACMAIVCTTC